MGWVVNATPRCFTPGKETWYPFYGMMGGPQGRSGRMRKISPPTGIRSPGRPAAASRYTDWAIPAHNDLQYNS